MRTATCCLVLCLPLFAQAQEPANLSHVPGNALGFVHVQTAEVWKSSWLKIYREILPRAGDEALALLESRIVPSLSTITRVTVVALPPNPQRGADPEFAVLLHLNKALDEKKFVDGLEAVQEGGAGFYRLRGDIAMQVLDKYTLLFGTPGSPSALAQGGKASESFKEAFASAAAGKKAIVAAANPSIIPAQTLAQMPPMVQSLARAKTVMLSLDLGDTLVLDVDLGYADAAQAKDAAEALEQARQLGKALLSKARDEMKNKLAQSNAVTPLYKFEEVAEIVGPVFALAMMKRAEEVLNAVPVAQQQARVSVKVVVPEELSSYASSGPILVALLLPAVQKVREAATRVQDANNLRQMGIAMHGYHDTYRSLPAAAICDPNGKPLLSWRVAILPFIEEFPLYQQFKLNEPWDSAHNKPLIARMPKVYQIPGVKALPGHTNYRVLVGPNDVGSALFRTYDDKVTFAKISDGTSNTLMIVEAEDAVPWTKPEELTFDPNAGLPRFNRRPQGFNVAFCDGSVRFMPAETPAATWRALITRAGGEVVEIPR